jgi:hypothetical protein
MVDILKNSDFKPTEPSVPPTRDVSHTDTPPAADDATKKTERAQELRKSGEYRLVIRQKKYRDSMYGPQKKTPKTNKKPASTEKQTKNSVSTRKKITQVGIIIALWAVVFVLIDTKTIDIGWTPPISIFGNDQTSNGSVSGTVEVGGVSSN